MAGYHRFSAQVGKASSGIWLDTGSSRKSDYGALCLVFTCLLMLTVACSYAIHQAVHRHVFAPVHTSAAHTQRPLAPDGQPFTPTDCPICTLLLHVPGTVGDLAHGPLLLPSRELLWDLDTSWASVSLTKRPPIRAPPVSSLLSLPS